MTWLNSWNTFAKSGSIEDYLSYRSIRDRQEERSGAGQDNGDHHPIEVDG
jgi:hypothetical protein